MPTQSTALRATLITLALLLPGPVRAQDAGHKVPDRGLPGIRESIRAEHEEIHTRLEKAMKAPGGTGRAARELARALHPHFVREEQIALPPLALLAPLARGEFSPAMRAILPLTDSLRAEMPRMLHEHAAIRAATVRLGEAARQERQAEAAELADELARHARSEEEILYPAAILIGEFIRARP